MTANDDLIEVAQTKLNPHRVGDRLYGDVAAALETTTGVIHAGVCIDSGSGTGFCAEHAAIASMVTSGEYEIARIDDTRGASQRKSPTCLSTGTVPSTTTSIPCNALICSS